MHFDSGSIRVPVYALIRPQFIPLSQVRDAAWMEVAEWRDDITFRNCRWTVWSSGGLGLGRSQAANEHDGGADRLQKTVFHSAPFLLAPFTGIPGVSNVDRRTRATYQRFRSRVRVPDDVQAAAFKCVRERNLTQIKLRVNAWRRLSKYPPNPSIISSAPKNFTSS